jgi:hypothetical protein
LGCIDAIASTGTKKCNPRGLRGLRVAGQVRSIDIPTLTIMIIDERVNDIIDIENLNLAISFDGCRVRYTFIGYDAFIVARICVRNKHW